MPKSPKKILFAAGGTGGHLFPAQALAEQLIEENVGVDLLFAGARLSSNAYFDKKKFPFQDIASTTPFSGGLIKAFKSVGILAKGVCESLRLLSREKPVLVVGFGSFHAFPVIFAAAIKKIPLVLFESNAIPGKVVRLFCKRAELTGIYFSEAKNYLRGNIVEVEIPVKRALSGSDLSREQARSQLLLDRHLPTLLVFGGSQGAKGINRNLLRLLPLLKKELLPFQLIHCTGCEETALEVSRLCHSLSIPCSVKKFEKNMELAWGAADVAVCRSGAMTLSELLHHEVPAILIPYPAASDQHQLKNALFLEKTVGGAVYIDERSLTPQVLAHTLLPLLVPDSPRKNEMRAAMRSFKAQQNKADLGRLIKQMLERK